MKPTMKVSGGGCDGGKYCRRENSFGSCHYSRLKKSDTRSTLSAMKNTDTDLRSQVDEQA